MELAPSTRVAAEGGHRLYQGRPQCGSGDISRGVPILQGAGALGEGTLSFLSAH